VHPSAWEVVPNKDTLCEWVSESGAPREYGILS